jgi:hypothetical protein
MARKQGNGAEMRRGNLGGSGQMPAGMTAQLKSEAIAGAIADGMPVAAMNGAGPRPNPMHAGSGRLQEMPPAGTSAFQEMPSGAMRPAGADGGGAGAHGAAGVHAATVAGVGPVFAEMPRAGGAPAPTAQAGAEPRGEPGVIALSGEWRLHLTLRG